VVKISTKKDAHGIMLSVEDNGLGLAPDEKDKLFIMFKRLHDHVEGTGVGLYIVKRIVENNGGKIEVESEKGKSTTFKILIKKSTKHVAV
jgi:signal transduction histidine kinase